MKAAVAAFVLAVAGTASAQTDYFGRNPVQWEKLNFAVLKTDHFDIYYYEEGRQAAEVAGRLAERWYTRLSTILDHKFKDRQALILYASPAQFQQTTAIGGAPGEGTGGVTEAYKRRIVLPVGPSLEETDHVIGHELTHAFQYSITGQARGSSGMPSAVNMPLWFIEGMAEYLSIGPVDPNTAMWMRDAVDTGKLPKISDLNNSRYFPYRYGQALWGYLAGRFGDHIFRDSLKHISPRSNDAEAILKIVCGVDAKQLSKDWQAAMREATKTTVASRKDPSAYGAALATKKGQGGSLNVGPALSPDGAQLAFLSEREQFSIELFLEDAQTGKIERRLSHAAQDPSVESLGFIYSAGAWDRSGKRFVLGEQSKGRPRLAVIEAESGKTIVEAPFPQLGEIVSPSFSPDGRRVVFSALANGFTDLYVYDLESQALTRLTEDAFADMQPAWSPDGKTIAFVTDRFSTELDTLAPGDYRLAAIDVDTRQIRKLPSFSTAKNINPQWSASGRSLYFISDATGISDIYRLDVGSGAVVRLTELKTGASGITSISPALSAAAAKDRLAYSVYDKSHLEIYSIDAAETLAGTPVSLEAQANANAAVIPGAHAEDQVTTARADAETGLPDPNHFTKAPYHARLGLDYVGQPYLAGGVIGGTGAFAGGISMQFSDMLGEHELQTAIQAESVRGFNDIGAIASYVNRSHRFNWGVQAGQVPYVSQGLATGFADNGGQVSFAQSIITEREMDRSISAIGIYPFDVATRLELQAGYRRISFDGQLDTDFFDPITGVFQNNQRQDLPSSPALGLGFGTIALVRDTSVFGATSPVMGSRMRLDLSPVTGSVTYQAALADFRYYLMPVRPVTIAARVLHYGRYGAGGDDPRLFPLFLGDPGVVRGYSSGSFEASECGTQNNGTCPTFDRLFGSRILVANVEVRAPLVGLFSSKNLYGPLPIEIGAFFDAGVAWDTQTKPAMFGGDRQIVKSIGAVARVNVLGFLVVEGDVSKPLDRPGKGAVFQVNLLTGF
jgi:WD40 repeat protein